MENLNNKIINATKWSTFTEIARRMILPITNMILARILEPEAFGVVATITMIVSFVDMFTDAGFQKFIIQYEFKSEEEKNIYINVAFWTNLCISIILCSLMIIFSDKIAIIVGNHELSKVISVSAIQLPITSFCSIQLAVYRRSLDLKNLSTIRIVGSLIPFITTIPLSILGFSYWSLIIGNICGSLFDAIAMTIKSKWKPQLKYNFEVLINMYSFCIWGLIESISTWLATWIDTFILGQILSAYYLGIYKTSLSTVNSIFGLITTTTVPILFSGLSRVQNDDESFNKLFFSIQKMAAYVLLPLSIGMFVFSDIVVWIFLGEGWNDANHIISIWALISGLIILLGNYTNEIFRAKGKPHISSISQVVYFISILFVCSLYDKVEFLEFTNLRAISRLSLVLINLLMIKVVIRIPIKKILNNILIPLIGSIVMGYIGIKLKIFSNSIIWSFICILICIIIYIFTICVFESSRKDIFNIIKSIKNKNIDKSPEFI